MQSPPMISAVARLPNWWERNWKWFVPTLAFACIAMVLGVVLSIVAAMRSSDAYQGALARVKDSPEVAAALGTGIEGKFLFTGNIEIHNDTGNASLAIPVTGTKGSGTAEVKAEKSMGSWHYESLIVTVEKTGQQIDISESSEKPK